MTALAVSVVVLWIAVLVLGIVVAALARQVGVLHERVLPAGALLMGSGARPGEAAPEVALMDLNGREVRIGGKRADGRHTLLFFLSPTCPVCKTLLPVLRSAHKAESAWLGIVLASDGDLQEQHRFVEQESLESFPYVVSRSLGVSYRVGKLPYAYLIDPEGVLVTGGLVNSREHLESIFNAKELSVASVQDYLRRRQAENQIA